MDGSLTDRLVGAIPNLPAIPNPEPAVMSAVPAVVWIL
jgi:hypothetical protein